MSIVGERATESDKPRFSVKAWLKFGSLGQVFLGHFLLTTLFTFPLLFNFGRALPGQLIEDRDQNIWNLWWVREALLHLRNPFRTDFIYFPDRTSLYFHTLHPLNGLISTPVQILFGLTVAYNFIVFFSFIMAGVGAYLLLDYLCQHKAVAFTASLIFAYAPYHLGTLKGVMQLISLEWLPFYVLFLLKASREPQNRLVNSLLAALFLVFTALTDWYYTLFLLGFTLLYIIYLVIISKPNPLTPFPSKEGGTKSSEKDDEVNQGAPISLVPKIGRGSGFLQKGGSRTAPTQSSVLSPQSFGAIGLTLVAFGVAMLPVLIPMLKELNSASYFLPDPADTRKFSADLMAFFIPPTTSSFLGWTSQNFPANYVTGPLAAQVYLGYGALGLAILGIIVTWKAWFWGGVALTFWVLSLGPALRVNGASPGWWLPFALLENLPVVKITRSPDRFIVITMLGLAVCAAFGLVWLVSKVPRWSWSVLGAVGLLITIEFLQIPYPINSFEVSPFFEQLAQDKDDYALLELPPQAGFWTGAPRMAEQTVHGKRIFDGYISREYDHPFQRRAPGFMELTTLKFGADIVPSAAEQQSWYDAFRYYHVRYIILRLPQDDKQRATANLANYRAAIAQIAPGDPIYRDKFLEAYALPAPPANPHPFVEIGDGWYEPEPTGAAATYHRWAAGSANLYLTWQGPVETKTTLKLDMLVLEGEKAARLSLDGATVWDGKLNTAPQSLNIPLTLTRGKHTLSFEVSGQATTPLALGLGNDSRRLLYLVTNISFPLP